MAALVPAMLAAPARAQTNIDQGKPPSELFANDCAACHKSPKGLANGKNSLMLTSFLREHYTASREQAAALAAFVLGAGGNAPAPAASKPGTTRAATEEPKTAARPGRQPARTPDESPSGSAKLQPPAGRDQKPEVAPPPEPAAVVASPAAGVASAPAESPSQSAPAPAESQPDDTAPVPRDNIPD